MDVQVPDIYFLPEWGKFFETKEAGGKWRLFETKSEKGHVFYQFIVRPISVQGDSSVFFDIITPYGFSGPVLLECAEGQRSQLAAEFQEQFQLFCEENNIVSEYIRFNPWVQNRLDFKDYYNFRDNGHTLYIDLTGKDYFMEQFSSASRRQVRKAIKNNVSIKLDFTGKSASEFHRLYMLTAEKNKIDDYYLFSEESLKASFEIFGGKQFFIHAVHEGQYISSSLILHHGDYMHYHLAANDPQAYPLAGNSLVISEACRWGVENSKKEFHLGGAGSDKNLFRFKRNFTKTQPLELLMGKKIRMKDAYDQLSEAKKTKQGIKYADYFPLYRG